MKRTDGMVVVVTFLTTLALGVQTGILLGVVFSFGYIIWQVTRPRVSLLGRVEGTEAGFQDVELCEAETWIDLLIVKVEGPLYFASAGQVENSVINLLADNPDVKAIIIDAGAITDLDYLGEKVLWELLKTAIVKEISFLMASVTRPVNVILRRSGFHEFLGPENFYPATPDAVSAIRNRKNTSQPESTDELRASLNA